MFFNTWADLLRVVVVGTLGYIALILILRISGKRTLAKMNMFDFVITIALGSTFASLLLSKTVALAEGVVALGLLVLLQYIVAFVSVRSPRFQQLVKGEPTLVYYRGQYMHDAMTAARITKEEVRAAARAEGVTDLATLGAVVLETDGTFSVMPHLGTDENAVMLDVADQI